MTEQVARGTGNVQISHVSDAEITISVNNSHPRSIPLVPAWIELPDGASPSFMVRARFALAPFIGDLAEELELSWCAPQEPFRLAIVVGRGGSGKTRLGVEMCRRLGERGWLTGLLKSRDDAEAWETLADAPVPRFVVIDYAETRQEQLTELLPALKSRASGEYPVRVLLTARVAATSDEEARHVFQGHDDVLDAMIEMARVDDLAERTFDASERQEMLSSAVTAFSERLGTTRPVPVLPEAVLWTPLTLTIAAFFGAMDEVIPTTRSELFDRLLPHEDRYWKSATESSGLACGDELRRRVVALVTLAGSEPGCTDVDGEQRGADLLRLIPDLTDASAQIRRGWARWAHDLYPGSEWWNPLEPDLFGEHLVCRVLEKLPQLPVDLIAASGMAHIARILTVLTRAAVDGHPEAQKALHDLLLGGSPLMVVGQIIDQAVQRSDLTLGQLLTAAFDAVADIELADAVLQEVPQYSHALLDLAAAATQFKVDQTADPGARAGLLNNLSNRLGDLGRREDALAAIEEAVALRRQLAEARPDAFTPDLATSLNNLSNRLGDLGRREDALAAIEEAAALCRQLAEARPDAFTPDLATSLNNLSNCLGNLGRREDALAAIEGAVALYRQLAEARPDAFTPDLAMSLNNLAGHLSDLGRQEDALAAIEEGVALRRQLAEARPDAFTPDLAMSLNNLSVQLSGLGRREDALAAIEEAVSRVLPQLERSLVVLPDAGLRLAQQYLACHEAVGREPNDETIARLGDVLRSAGVIDIVDPEEETGV